LKVR
jgi:protein fantom